MRSVILFTNMIKYVMMLRVIQIYNPPPIASFQRHEVYEYQPIENQLIIDPKGVNTNA